MAVEADEFVFFDARDAALAPVDEVAHAHVFAAFVVSAHASRFKHAKQGQLASAVDVVLAKVKVGGMAYMTQRDHAHTLHQTAIGTDRAVAMSLSDPPLGSRNPDTLNKATTTVIMCG
jgi:hypothetical protein